MMQLMLMSSDIAARDAGADDALVLAAAEGDRSAFGELYLRYARMVHGILLARVPPGEAEDLTQEVFLSAMKQLRGLRTAAAFRGWLGTITRNRAMDHYRRARETAKTYARVDELNRFAAVMEQVVPLRGPSRKSQYPNESSLATP